MGCALDVGVVGGEGGDGGVADGEGGGLVGLGGGVEYGWLLCTYCSAENEDFVLSLTHELVDDGAADTACSACDCDCKRGHFDAGYKLDGIESGMIIPL